MVNLNYAVDRLVETGWSTFGDFEVEYTADGRAIPSLLSIQREFSRAGLELSIKQNLMFGCYRATWAPVGEPLDPSHAADERHGTVVGSCEKEAAVFALAQLRATQPEHGALLANA